MILFSACCICGLIGGILNFQFLRAVTKKTSFLYPLHIASMSLACIGIGGCTISSWLTCRLASYEQRRMFSEREHSLHHSHEMAEKRLRAIEITDLPSCPAVPPTPELPTRKWQTWAMEQHNWYLMDEYNQCFKELNIFRLLMRQERLKTWALPLKSWLHLWLFLLTISIIPPQFCLSYSFAFSRGINLPEML